MKERAVDVFPLHKGVRERALREAGEHSRKDGRERIERG